MAAVCTGAGVPIVVGAVGGAVVEIDAGAGADNGFGASPVRIQNAAAIAVASTATPRTMRVADWFKEMTAFLFPRRSRSREQSS